MTQRFHMARALYDARRAGLEVTGFAADRRDYGRVMRRLRVREAAARVKTLGDVVTAAEPHFLGAAIPITGDGRAPGDLIRESISSVAHVSTLQATDRAHLARAIELAEGGRGRTSPNPLVGAVIVRDGEVLGEGFHAALGGPHAERAAIAAAGAADLRGATLYVSLEPCCHPAARRRAPTRSSRPASRASWWRPTTRPRRPPAAASGSCATRASRSTSPTASSPPRAAAQPAFP